MSKTEDSIAEGAQGLLEPGERMSRPLCFSPPEAAPPRPPGGSLGPGEIGARWSKKNSSAAADVGLIVKRSSGLALTTQRLLTLDLSISLTGAVKEVKGLLSEIPLDQVDGIRSKWPR